MKNSKKLYWYVTGLSTLIILIIGFEITPIVSKIHKESLFNPINVNIETNQKSDDYINDKLLYPWNKYDKINQQSIVSTNGDITNYWEGMNTYDLISKIAKTQGIEINELSGNVYNKDLKINFNNSFLVETIPKLTFNKDEYNIGDYLLKYYYQGEYNNQNISYVIKNGVIPYFSVNIQEDEDKLSKQVVSLKSMINNNNSFVTNYVNKILNVYKDSYNEFPIYVNSNDISNNTPEFTVIDNKISVIYYIDESYLILFYSFEKGDFVGYSCIKE